MTNDGCPRRRPQEVSIGIRDWVDFWFGSVYEQVIYEFVIYPLSQPHNCGVPIERELSV
jgi:hypothetical protein